MPQHNEKITFKKYIIVNNTVITDLKNIFACLYDVLSLHKINSIYIAFNYLVSQLFK